MEKKTIIIDGDRFCDMKSFCEEVDRVLTKDLNWKTGHCLDAFNDILRGGFGVHHYQEEIVLKWINSAKSKSDLGKTMFDDLMGVIWRHEHVELVLE